MTAYELRISDWSSDVCSSDLPVIGSLLAVARPGSGADGKPPVIDWLALYAQDEKGYDNLCGLVSSAHLDRPVHEAPHVALHALAGRTDGLIALTAGREGAVTQLLADGPATAGRTSTRLNHRH